MAIFPLVADKVALLSAAPTAADPYVGGIRRKADNSAVLSALSGGVAVVNGLLVTEVGQLVVVDATAGLPAGTQWVSGLPIAPSGALCTSTDAVFSWVNGLPFAISGALSVSGANLDAQVAALLASIVGPTPWYDPSDLATLFQDDAGTTPVTAVGQPVGRMLDKSGKGAHMIQPSTTSRPTFQQGGVLSWLQFDGVDDGLYTSGNVDFSGSDESSLYAGLRKESDAAAGIFCELGVNTNTVPGSFAMVMPYGPTGAERVGFRSRGSSLGADPFFNAPSAPSTFVATGRAKISTPLSELRINGVVVASQSASQGAGNYQNGKLFLGRRNDASNPFTGRLYGTIAAPQLLTGADLTLVEQWCAQRAGVTLP